MAAADGGRPGGQAATGGFAELGVPSILLDVLLRQGVTSPFPIQTATLPDTLAGRDVLGGARTGSGKTLAFCLPMVARVATSATPRAPGRPRGLILAPTRELARQIQATLEPLASSAGLRTAVVFGGVAQQPQVNALRTGVDILVACPGRLEDLMRQRHCDLRAVEVTVIDEADHMAELGFLPAVRRILDRTPARGQRLLFTATLDKDVDVVVKSYLKDPLTHSLDSGATAAGADSADGSAGSITHHVYAVASEEKSAIVRELAAGQRRCLMFTRTKHGAKKLAASLTAAGIPAVDLHGNLSQAARERNLATFTAGTARVLVATDIAARGIHVADIALVVHVDPPAEHKAYLHRSGRTARAGAAGTVVTLMTPDQRTDVRALARHAKIEPATVTVTPGHGHIRSLVGEPAALVPATARPVTKPDQGPRSRSRSRGGPTQELASPHGRRERDGRLRAPRFVGTGAPRRRGQRRAADTAA